MSMRERTTDNALVTTGTADQPKNTSLRLVTGGAIVRPDGRAVAALRQAAAVTGGRSGRIGFLIDATGSRSESWREAQLIQRKMFEKASAVGKMMLRLIHYGGSTTSDHGWMVNANEVASKMAAVSCQSGQTQINIGLSQYLQDTPMDQAKSVIMVGDSFEEDETEAYRLAAQFKQRGIKVFACHEGNNGKAEAVFRRIASITGGKFFKLGEDLPFDEICENIALLTIGGPDTLRRLGRGASTAQLLAGPSAPSGPQPGQP